LLHWRRPPLHGASPFRYTTLFRSVGKCLKAAVKSRCNHRLFYRMLGQDAGDERERTTVSKVVQSVHHKVDLPVQLVIEPCLEVQDRKSTRLNSSHVSISYAVFCSQ